MLARSSGLVSGDDGWRIPDWLWQRLAPLIPPPPAHPLGCCRPRVPDRIVMNAILMVLRTELSGTRWTRPGSVTRRPRTGAFRKWRAAGVFHEIWRQALLEYDEQIGIDWSFLAADGAMTKAPLGGPKTGPNPTERAKRGPSARSSLVRRRGPDRARARGCAPP